MDTIFQAGEKAIGAKVGKPRNRIACRVPHPCFLHFLIQGSQECLALYRPLQRQGNPLSREGDTACHQEEERYEEEPLPNVAHRNEATPKINGTKSHPRSKYVKVRIL